ncbi:DEAD/DEAH box helicase [Variovorax guangxiensis]|uniref:DEAD/DEAH-box helicase domain-containing protein n=1 Tax=Variovorax guangxiensis TaxID=1775474 RepID=A0A840FTC7_9BURK|nr:DEAD/DEAH box helicase [Variovorax guangxiensis]MBB4225866.1 hypothetical protein [Variovorax guangxiensis]
MTLTPDLSLVEKALDKLERLEVRVLVWGLVDSALSNTEVEDALRDTLNENQAVAAAASCTIDTEARLRERLLELGYLTEVPGRPLAPARYRTRMAEGVRLFARLRQLFPGKHDGSDWVSGATLVADYRLLWRPRKYPARDLTPDDAHAVIAARITDPRLLAAVKRWLDAGEPSWRFARFQIDASARILEGLSMRSPRGTLVAAGTGSGKTLAFYLPALAWLSSERKTQPRSRGVRVLALYPRNELLKDQLAEVYGQARKFDDELGRVGTTLSVGVLFGDQKLCRHDRSPACSVSLQTMVRSTEIRLTNGASMEATTTTRTAFQSRCKASASPVARCSCAKQPSPRRSAVRLPCPLLRRRALFHAPLR